MAKKKKKVSWIKRPTVSKKILKRAEPITINIKKELEESKQRFFYK